MNATLPSEFTALAGRRLVVTGAEGLIGGALFRRLADWGLRPVATVLTPDAAARLRAEGHEAHRLDLASAGPWDDALRGADIVFAIAGLFQEVEQGDAAYDCINRVGALRLVETASRAGVRRYVHCSTVGVHGSVLEMPATERTPFHPMDPYQRSKLAGERAVLEFAAGLPADGMTVTVNRPAMVYGPGDRRMLKLFRAVVTRRFVMVGSGRTLAHLAHIDDQVDSLLRCATAPREQVHREAFNIASGEPLTLAELVALIAAEAGVRLSRWRLPLAPVWLAACACEIACAPLGIKPPLFRRRVDFFRHNRAFDLTKARERLGYVSRRDHRRGIAETLDWYAREGWLPPWPRSADAARGAGRSG